MEPLERYLNITQACEYARVTRRTIYNWIERGKLKYFVTPSGKKRIRVSDLIRKQDIDNA